MAKHGLHRHQLPAVFTFAYQRKVGLLGGSFNPAHDGHIALSLHAKRIGKFDEIWWLVSPQNPLKSSQDMADFDKRLQFARALCARHRWLRVLALEQLSSTNYSYDTCRFVKRRAPRVAFTWLMGSDNLLQFPQWYRAKDMANLMPFMVLRRDDSFYASLVSKGRQYFRKYRQGDSRKSPLPNLRLIYHFHHKASATAVRKAGHWT